MKIINLIAAAVVTVLSYVLCIFVFDFKLGPLALMNFIMGVFSAVVVVLALASKTIEALVNTVGFRDSARVFETEFLLKFEVFLAILIVINMVGLGLAGNLLRTVISGETATDAADVVKRPLGYLIIVIGFLGTSIGISKREVIQMDILRRLYPSGARQIITFITYVVIIIFMAFIYLITFNFYKDAIDLGGEEGITDAKWVNYAITPLVGLIAFKCFLMMVNTQIEQKLDDGSE